MFIQYVAFVTGFFHLVKYFQGPSCCSMYKYFISFYGWIVYCMASLPSVYPSVSDGHLLCSQFGAIMSNSDENICVRVFVLTNPPNVNQPHKTLKEKSYNKIIKKLFYNNFAFFKTQPFSHPITQKFIMTGKLASLQNLNQGQNQRRLDVL